MIRLLAHRLGRPSSGVFVAALILSLAGLADAATINVQSYGARGNGGSDDAGAIQAAIAASAPGDTVYFPNGTYLISTHLNLAGGRTYQGQSLASVIKRSAAEDLTAIFAEFGGATNATVDTLTFDTGGLFIGSRSSNVTIKNSKFQNVQNCSAGTNAKSGLWLSDFTSNVTISGNTFYNTYDCNSYNINSDDYKSAGLYMYNPNGPTTVTNNVFDTLYQGVSLHLTSAGSYSNMKINNNEFRNIHRMAIEAQGNFSPAPGLSNFQIDNNYFHDYHQNFWNTFGISLVIGGTNQEIKGNTVDNTSSAQCNNGNGCADGIEFGEGVAVISGNTVKSYFSDGIAIGSRTSGTVITGNTLCGSSPNLRIAYENSGDSGSSVSNNSLSLTCGATSAPPPPPSPPTISGFNASPASITSGQSTTLSWSQNAGTSVTIDNGVGDVTDRTSVAVSPTQTTTYTVTTSNASGRATATVTVTVAAAVKSPTLSSFAASPASIAIGQSSTLSWSQNNATTVTIDNGVGDVSNVSSVDVSPSQSTTYTLTATNSAGGVTATASVSVASGPPTLGPTAPSQLVGTSPNTNSVQLSWLDNSTDETGFIIQRRATNGGGAYATTGTVGAGATSFTDSGLTPYWEYDYQVLSTNGTTNSAPSAKVTVQVGVTKGSLPPPPPPVLTVPAIASALSGYAPTFTSIALQWQDTGGTATSFMIQRRETHGASTFATVGNVNGGTLKFVDNGLNPFWQYDYQVVSTNAAGSAAPSATLTVQAGITALVSIGVVDTVPAPKLSLASAVTSNDTAVATYPSGFNVTSYQWVVTPFNSGLATSTIQHPFTLVGPGTLSLSTLGLAAGRFQVQAAAIMDSNGKTLSPWSSVESQLRSAAVLVSGSAATVYPNPWRIDHHRGHSITFAGLADGSRVRIFTVSAHYITSVFANGSSASWNPSDAASGIYLYTVEDPQGGKSKGKFVVIH